MAKKRKKKNHSRMTPTKQCKGARASYMNPSFDGCGEMLPVTAEYYQPFNRSKDGFGNMCHKCRPEYEELKAIFLAEKNGTARPRVDRNQIKITPEFDSKYKPFLPSLKALAQVPENLIVFLHSILINEDRTDDYWAPKHLIQADIITRFRIEKGAKIVLTGFNLNCYADKWITVHKVINNPDHPTNFVIDKYQITQAGIEWYNLWIDTNGGLPVPIVPEISLVKQSKEPISGHSKTEPQFNSGIDNAFSDAQNKTNVIKQVVEVLKDYKAEHQFTFKELGQRCGLGEYYVKALCNSSNETNKKTPTISDEKLNKLVHWLQLNKKFKKTEFNDGTDSPETLHKMLLELIAFYGGVTKLAGRFGVTPNAIYGVRTNKAFSKKMRKMIKKYYTNLPMDSSVKIAQPEPEQQPEPKQQELELNMPEVEVETKTVKTDRLPAQIEQPPEPEPEPEPEQEQEPEPVQAATHVAKTNGNGAGIDIVQNYLLKDLVTTKNELDLANAELTKLRIENEVLKELLKNKMATFT